MNDRRLAKLRSTVTYELSWWHRGDSSHRDGIRYYKRQWNRAVRRTAREDILEAIS